MTTNTNVYVLGNFSIYLFLFHFELAFYLVFTLPLFLSVIRKFACVVFMIYSILLMSQFFI